MCLYIKESGSAVKSDEDIVVYKVVTTTRTLTARWNSMYNPETVGGYYSPFWGHVYTVGELYNAQIGVERINYDVATLKRWHLDSFYQIGEEECRFTVPVIEQGLHSFANYSDAQEFINNRGDKLYVYVILKCMIPAGSVAFLGKWTYNYAVSTYCTIDSYASESLRVIEEMK